MMAGASTSQDVFRMVKDDPYLEPFQGGINARYALAQKWITAIESNEGSLDAFSRSYEQRGFHVLKVSDRNLCSSV